MITQQESLFLQNFIWESYFSVISTFVWFGFVYLLFAIFIFFIFIILLC